MATALIPMLPGDEMILILRLGPFIVAPTGCDENPKGVWQIAVAMQEISNKAVNEFISMLARLSIVEERN